MSEVVVGTCSSFKLALYAFKDSEGHHPCPHSTPKSNPDPLLTARDIRTGCQENRPGMRRGCLMDLREKEASILVSIGWVWTAQPSPKEVSKWEPLLVTSSSHPPPILFLGRKACSANPLAATSNIPISQERNAKSKKEKPCIVWPGWQSPHTGLLYSGR